LAGCLAEKGWTVEVSADGGITFEGPDEQLEPYREAKSSCMDELGFARPEAPPITLEMLEAAYAMQVDTLQCLRDEGYDELSDPPSLQSYIDANAQWTPYAELPLQISEEDWMQLQVACPQPSLEDWEG
jgi:hypothetical protein